MKRTTPKLILTLLPLLLPAGWAHAQSSVQVRQEATATAAASASSAATAAQDKERLLKISNPTKGGVVYKGLTLDKACALRIKGRAASVPGETSKGLVEDLYYAWILNSRNRKVVWHTFSHGQASQNRRYRGYMDFDLEIYLEAGVYEVYYTHVRSLFKTNHSREVLEKFWNLHKRLRNRRTTVDPNQLYLEIRGDRKAGRETDADDYIQQLSDRAAVSIRCTSDGEHKTQAFELEEPVRMGIYAQGEGIRRNDTLLDFAWIEDVTRNKKVWQMGIRNSEWGGGNRKNLFVREEMVLPKGKYMVHFVTDDSHSCTKWDAQPPFDPLFWGITLWPKGKVNKVKTIELKYTKPVVSFTKVGNNQNLAKLISLEKNMGIRIFCMGERAYNGMVDRGTIEDATTGAVIWDMSERRTYHAGGSVKNRKVTEIINLTKGNYVVRYQTDGSHSYPKWNDDAPADGDKWGMTLSVLDPADHDMVRILEKLPEKIVVASILKPGNQEYLEKSFSLPRNSKVRVVAIGEGTQNDGMADYGWIENDDTGRVIWVMGYDKTTHAGGARKNRRADHIITLAKGNYKLYFETDNSHAYGSWNSAEPSQPESYGISLLLAD